MLPLLDGGDRKAIAAGLDRIDELRDQLDQQLDAVRNDMIGLLQADSAATVRKQQTVLVIAIILTVLAAALGLVFSLIVSGGLTRPVRRLLDGARAVQAGRLDETLAVTSQDEIGHLTVAFNSMVEQLRAKERMRETFGRYVDPRIVERLISGAALATEGQRRVMTVLFCDVKGFVGVSEEMTPQGLVKVMNRYFSTMSAPIHAHGGIIDKYIGDAIMAFWGSPYPQTDHALCACSCALQMSRGLAKLNVKWKQENRPPIAIGIGLNTGPVNVGNMGSEKRLAWTVMGDNVNLASRLEGITKEYQIQIVISESTYLEVAGKFVCRELDKIKVKGKNQPVNIYELLGVVAEKSKFESLLAGFDRAMTAYRSQNWRDAAAQFGQLLATYPDDGPTRVFLQRALEYLENAPEPDWDGVYVMKSK